MTAKTAKDKSKLVPERFEDFRSVGFWDDFFDTRGEQPFEWYGDFRQLRPFLRSSCAAGQEVLIVGCGNSELSAELYDDGCESITNIDFSKKVIASMMTKNVRRRPKMRWKVGDMTNMKIKDASFDVVLDKGGLDALMGDESPESSEAGRKLLQESARVLKSGGCYLCITLAQSHVLQLLLEELGEGWSLDFAPVPPSLDMARSALQPVFVTATKTGTDHTIKSSVNRSDRAPNAQQLAAICEIIEAEETRRATGSSASNGDTAANGSPDFDGLHPGRRLCLDLVAPSTASSNGTRKAEARFSAHVLDVPASVAATAARSCCVFLIPQDGHMPPWRKRRLSSKAVQGRESEWLLTSEEGQQLVASQCASKRVIFVVMNRGHVFEGTQAVRMELSPLVRPLAPLSAREVPDGIPILTTEEGVGRRRELEAINSPISGCIIVEDVALQEEEETRLVRRLVFMTNKGLVQSETLLLPISPTPPVPIKRERGKKKNKRKEAKQLARQQQNFSWGELAPDHSQLSMEYHNHIVAGLSLSGCLKEIKDLPGNETCLVVGLGSGALAVYLHTYLGLSVKSVELDRAVVELAERYFGFTSREQLQVKVADGLEEISSIASGNPNSLAAIIIDAGSGDASLAMSCPPPAFLEEKHLQDAKRALQTSGLLAVNCVTRSIQAVEAALSSMQAVFAHVYVSSAEKDVNKVIFATDTLFSGGLDGKTLKTRLMTEAKQLSDSQIQAVTEQFAGVMLWEKQRVHRIVE